MLDAKTTVGVKAGGEVTWLETEVALEDELRVRRQRADQGENGQEQREAAGAVKARRALTHEGSHDARGPPPCPGAESPSRPG